MRNQAFMLVLLVDANLKLQCAILNHEPLAFSASLESWFNWSTTEENERSVNNLPYTLANKK